MMTGWCQNTEYARVDDYKIGRLPKWPRGENYKLKPANCNIINDAENNDTTPLVNTISNSDNSRNINGRAGAGRSHLAKMLQN